MSSAHSRYVKAMQTKYQRVDRLESVEASPVGALEALLHPLTGPTDPLTHGVQASTDTQASTDIKSCENLSSHVGRGVKRTHSLTHDTNVTSGSNPARRVSRGIPISEVEVGSLLHSVNFLPSASSTSPVVSTPTMMSTPSVSSTPGVTSGSYKAPVPRVAAIPYVDPSAVQSILKTPAAVQGIGSTIGGGGHCTAASSVAKPAGVYEVYCTKDTYQTEHENQLMPHASIMSAKWHPATQAEYDEMSFDEQLIWRSLNHRHHVCISGRAGAGKSFLIKKFLEHAGKTSMVLRACAPTAIAAFNIGGQTLHKALGLGLAQEPAPELWKKLQRLRRPLAGSWKFLMETEVLLLDEMSMIHPDMFEKLDFLFRHARKNLWVPFGGCLLVLLGDMTQLGPVHDTKTQSIASPRNAETPLTLWDMRDQSSKLLIQTMAWKSMSLVRVVLQRSYRQQEGDEFLEVLNHVRMGFMTPRDELLLRSRIKRPTEDRMKRPTEDCNPPRLAICTTIPESPEEWDGSDGEGDATMSDGDVPKVGEAKSKEVKMDIDSDSTSEWALEPMDIFPRIYQVDERNKQCVEKLVSAGAKSYTFQPTFHMQARGENNKNRASVRTLPDSEFKHMQGLLQEKGHLQLRKLFPFYDLTVCRGAQVMMRNNSLIMMGIFNGTMGVVTKVNEYEVEVKFRVGQTLETQSRVITRAAFTVNVGAHSELVMNQYPITLAYACTIHKVQGLTLDWIRLDASACWEPGQLYTALSRVRRLEDLELYRFDKNSLLVDPVALAFENVTGGSRVLHGSPSAEAVAKSDHKPSTGMAEG